MDLIEYLRGIRRRSPVILAAVIVGLVGAWFIGGAPETSGDSAGEFEASVLLLDARSSQVSFGQRAIGIPIDTLATLTTFDDIAKRAAEKLDVDTEPEDLASSVSAVADSQGSILTITATAGGGPRAERVARAFADALVGYVKDIRRDEIQPQIDSLRTQLRHVSLGRGGDSSARQSIMGQISSLNTQLHSPIGFIIEPQQAHEVSAVGLQGPTSLIDRLLIGAAIGLLGGIVLALVLERFDQRIRTRRAAEQHLAMPLLAEIPRLARASRKRVSVTHQPTSLGADAFRLLASAVVHSIQARSANAEGNGHGALPPATMLAITSAGQGEGKSLVAANLAAALGELGKRVIVISCDLRRPKVHSYFGASPVPGVVDALQAWDGQQGFRRINQQTSSHNVSVISAGSPTARPAAILAGDDMGNLLRLASGEAEIVILDTPAILLAGDAAALTQSADGVLLVSRVGTTPIEAAERVSELLERLGAPVIGYVLNSSNVIGGGFRYRPYRAPKVTVVLPPSEPVRVPRLAASEAQWRG